jgi:NAD(P)-dependent dehydrogenase (short-subunit alcohol dehydrogenase family)
MKITGSVALVTGANRGLGKAYVEALLSSGVAKVYAGARDLSKITDSRVIPVQLDVSSRSEIKCCGEAMLRRHPARQQCRSDV